MSSIILQNIEDFGWQVYDPEKINPDELERRGIKIDSTAMFGSGVIIYNNVTIGAGSFIGDGGVLCNRVHVGIGTYIHPRSAICKYAKIGNGCILPEQCFIGKSVVIPDNEKVFFLTFSGSKHPVFYWGGEAIQIGCTIHSIEHWLNEYAYHGNYNSYTSDQISEYGDYIRTIAKIHQNRTNDKKGN